MKRISYILLLIISIVLTTTVSASSINETIHLQNTLSYENVNYIYGLESNYILLEETNNNTIVSIYNNENLLVKKQFPNLINARIIERNDHLILVGISSNILKIIDIDSNLIINKQIDSSILMNKNYQINLYNFDNKIYIIQTKNNLLKENKIYEIDDELNISENNFSSYETSYLKSILKDDYYSLIHNEETINDDIIHYNNSTYITNKNILIGNNETNAVLKILDNDNNEILFKEYGYQEFTNIAVVNKKIIILAKDNKTYKLLEISSEGEIIDQIDLEGNDMSLIKTGDKILITSKEDKKTTLSIYTYTCDIEVEESVLGTIRVQNDSEPYKKVSIEAIPNSGYTVESITITDAEDNVIATNLNNEFVMPNSNVVIVANYKQSVNNPETMDIILFFFIALIITVLIMSKTYNKYKWLKE